MASLRPGNMGKSTDPVDLKPADFKNSMAEAMENALNSLCQSDGINTFQVDTNSREARDRRRLFLAIAQGIVRHLVDNAGALQVLYQGSSTGENIDIQADGTLL